MNTLLTNIEAGKGLGKLGTSYNGLSSGMQGLLGAAGSAVGNIGGSIIGGGYSSGAGSVFSNLGNLASAIPGPWGMVASAGLGLLGGLTNRMFGSKLNQENINAVENNIGNMLSFNSNAGDFDSLNQNILSSPASMRFNSKFIGSDGWFSSKASDKYRDLLDRQTQAKLFVDASIKNNASNLQTTQGQNLMAISAAYGGPLNMRKGVLTPFGNRFSFGGVENKMHTNGGDWSNGLTFIDNGGTHEGNPYNGVLMGVDPQGIPNLVEEGEVVWDDYVFSNRLKVPKAVRNKYKLRGKKNLTFADAVKNLQKEAEERPNDPISNRGLDAMLSRLASSQEEKRQKDYIAQLKRHPELLEQELAQQEQTPEVMGLPMAKGGDIHIDKNKRGTFTKAANERGLGVQEFASKVLANPDNYSESMRKKAQFAKNAASWKHGLGGNLFAIGGIPFTIGTTPFMEPAEPTKLDYANLSPKQLGVTQDEYNWWKGLTDYQRILAGNYYYPGETGSRDWANSALYNPDVQEGRHILSWASKLDSKGQDNSGGSNLAVKRAYAARDSKTGNVVVPKDSPITTMPSIQFKDRRNLATEFPSPTLTPEQQSSISRGVQIQQIQSTRNNNGSNNNNDSSWLTGLRYVPVLGAGLNVFTDLMGWTNKPDYSNAEAVLNASRGIRNVKFNPIGDYMKYTPMDRMFYLNQLNANAGASRRALLNTAGNRGTAAASILASDYNTIGNIGKLAREAEEYNLKQRQLVSDFNRGTNQFNSEGSLKAQQANMGGDEVRMRAAMEAARMRDTVDQRVGAARSANLTNFLQSLGDIGWEEYNRNMANSVFGYGIGRSGNAYYKYLRDNWDSLTEEEKKQALAQRALAGKKGGYLTIKKRR